VDRRVFLLALGCAVAACHGEHGGGPVHSEGPCTLVAEVMPPDDVAAASTHQFVLPAGAFGELEVDMRPGARLVAYFEATGATVAWNVHTHAADGAEVVHSEGVDASGMVDFVAEAEDAYSLMFRGEGPVETSLCVAPFLAGDASLVE
jgi:hypothetical protein